MPEPGPQDQFLFEDSFTSDDWKEAVDLHSPAQLALGRKRSYATVVGYVDYSRLKAAIRWLMGHSWVDENLFLRREPPAMHPVFTNLACTEITECTGITFVRKSNSTSPDALPFATYNLARLTVAYSQPPYDILYDMDVSSADGAELDRWTLTEPHPYVDQLVQYAGEILFDAPGKDWDNKPIAGPKNIIRSEKSAIKLTHFNVPLNYVQDTNGLTPKHAAAVGKANSDVFLGKDPGCWLLDDVDVQIYGDPVAGDILNDLGKRCDVVYTLKHFDPERGTSSTTKGWLLEPAVDGLWYPTKRGVGTAAKIRSTSFLKLFTHWSKV